MLGGDPPDTFQVHAGKELIDTWVKTGFMEPLTDLFESEGWVEVMPKGILDIVSYEGDYWSVPVNIHKANVLWYNKQIFADNGLNPPQTFDEFFEIADKLQEQGIIPFCFGNKDGWEAAHVFETVLIAKLGAEGYSGLWTGETKWSDPGVTEALETFKKMVTYVNPDHAAFTWDEAYEYIIDGKGAMSIMGDWVAGYFFSKEYTDFDGCRFPKLPGYLMLYLIVLAFPRDARIETMLSTS